MYEDAIQALKMQGIPEIEDAKDGGANPRQTNALDLIREGLPVTVLLVFYKIWHLKQAEVASMLGISERHVQRLKSNGRLNSSQSEKTLAVLQLLEETADYFGARDTALHWLRQSRLALKGNTPMSMVDTMTGVRMVSDLLNQLLQGMTA